MKRIDLVNDNLMMITKRTCTFHFLKLVERILLKKPLLFVFYFLLNPVFAQQDSTAVATESIAVIVRPSADSITLRWAPIDANTWLLGNKSGYILERYTLVRGGAVLNQPERMLLTSLPIKPSGEQVWEKLVTTERYAPIAAQALLGEKFELELTRADVMTIVNKVRENELRHSFALFCADMSPAVAHALGLLFTDHSVRKGEKYLYRIHIPISETYHVESIFQGSVFSSTDDAYKISQPLGLQIEVEESVVALKWEKNDRQFTAYIVERSEDGSTYKVLSDLPMVTLSPTNQSQRRLAYQSDSISDPTKTYYYRVRGVTAFGEMSKPSEVVSGKVNRKLGGDLHIIEGETSDNVSIQVKWDFPSSQNDLIKGFSIERSDSPRGKPIDVLPSLLPPQARSFVDTKAQQINYYKVVAFSQQGDRIESPLFFAQLIDSIAPLAPIGLKADIDEFGNVKLKWESNVENDFFGYRLYRGNTASEELAQLTSEPITSSAYFEKVNTETLNESIVYGVIAVDRNQNQSPMSALLKVDLPDKLPPMAVVMLPVENSTDGVKISWTKSSSTDVIQYDVYKGIPDSKEWIRIKIIKATTDSTYSYLDEFALAGSQLQYTVLAIDKSGLESQPASSVIGNKQEGSIRESITWKSHRVIMEEGRVLLQWVYEGNDVTSFKLYRAIDNASPVLYKTIQSDQDKFVDSVVPGKEYTYWMQIVFEKSLRSKMSEKISVNY